MRWLLAGSRSQEPAAWNQKENASVSQVGGTLRWVGEPHFSSASVACVKSDHSPAMIVVRPRRRGVPSGGNKDEVEGADDLTRLRVPLHKKLFFLAKIERDKVAEQVSKMKFPGAMALADRKLPGMADLRKAYDDFTNPEFKPDRRRLTSVEDFFRYTEEEGQCRRRTAAKSLPPSTLMRISERRVSIRLPERCSPSHLTPRSRVGSGRWLNFTPFPSPLFHSSIHQVDDFSMTWTRTATEG